MGNDTHPKPIGWDHPDTARFYEEFCARHDRYREANAALIANAHLATGQHVLDIAAGSGGTSAAVLPLLGVNGQVLCVEPADAMCQAGRARLDDTRVTWQADWPDASQRFDRILCGAAIWQITPLSETFKRVRALLNSDGAFCFNIPTLYLGEADEPGDGADPLLMLLPRLLAQAGTPTTPPVTTPLPDAAGIDALLQTAGFRVERWSFRLRLSQEAYRDWLKIPVLTDWLLGEMAPVQRAQLLDALYQQTDTRSWRYERWAGWTAWAR